ncbi:MAG: dihydrolipoyl dehydrogenase [Muribaculaceae bacterium]|nr:dihydrolipoyl dehydrogenase [Muribaculaceae bacterium]
MTSSCDLLIIGAGPAGYELAAEASRKGMSVIIIERSLPGGTCLNRGCIPTKALCRSAQIALDVREGGAFGVTVDPSAVTLDYARAVERKDEVVTALREGVAMAIAKARVVIGNARFIDSHMVEVDGETFTAPRIVIATGSAPASLPIPGADLAINSDALLSLSSLPSRITIIGGGVIGMEFASILSAFGCEVTVIEYCKEILPPFDKDIAKRLRQALGRRGVNIIVGAAVTAIEPGFTVSYESKGKQLTVEADAVVMAVGRRPVIPDGAAGIGIESTRRGITVDASFQTTVPGIYAVGDVNGICMLAHAATAQALSIIGETSDMSVIPAAVFTAPECAMVGLTEEQCKTAGLDYKSAKSLFRANGKATAMAENDGMVKMIIDASSRRILGCHICGPHAADLISEVALAMTAGLPVDALVRTIHAHPTLGEAVQAAARMF